MHTSTSFKVKTIEKNQAIKPKEQSKLKTQKTRLQHEIRRYK